MKHSNRILAVLLSLMITLTYMPAIAFAGSGDGDLTGDGDTPTELDQGTEATPQGGTENLENNNGDTPPGETANGGDENAGGSEAPAGDVDKGSGTDDDQTPPPTRGGEDGDPDPAPEYAVMIGDTGYDTLKAAITAVEPDGTAVIILQKDLSRADFISYSSKSITLDLNGHSYSRTNSGAAIQVGANATFTLKDSVGGGSFNASTGVGIETKAATAVVNVESGTVSGTNYGIGSDNGTVTVSGGDIIGGSIGIYTKSGNITVSGGTVTGETIGIQDYDNDKAATITVTGGVIKANATTSESGAIVLGDASTLSVSGNDTELIGGYSGIAVFDAASVTIDGGSVSGASFGVTGNGSDGYGGYTINVNGGTISASDGVGIYHPNSGTVNISGGSVTGKTGVYQKAGELNITGGTITGNGAKSAYSFNNNGANSTGDAVVIDNCGYPGGAPAPAITGGTFNSTNADPVGSYAYTPEGAETNVPAAGFVSGGSFDGEVSESLCAEGFVLEEQADGSYAVVEEVTLKPIKYFYTWSVPNVFYFDDEDPVPSRTTQGTIPTIKREDESSYHEPEDFVTISWKVTDSSAGSVDAETSTIATVDANGLVTFSEPGSVKVWLIMTDSAGTKSAYKPASYTIAPAYIERADGKVAYSSLLAAFNAAQTGETVVLGKDATLSNIGKMELKDGRDISVDLNGHSVKMTQDYSTTSFGAAFTVKKGSLTIKDSAGGGKVEASGRNCRAFNLDGTANEVASDAKLVIDKGVSVSSAKDSCVTVFGKATLETSGDLDSPESFAIAGNGSEGKGGYVIEVKDGSVTGDDVAIYHPNEGTLTVSGGTITGATGIYQKAGTLNITGGTITGNGAKAEYTFNGDGCNATGDAVVIDNCGYPGGAPAPEITGGTFISTNADPVGSYAYTPEGAETNAPAAGFVSGGSFNGEVPESLCAEGFIVEDSGDGTYEVVEDLYVAKIGDKKYKSLQSAFDAGGDVTLLKDVTDVGTQLTIGKNVTLDLNGNNITGSVDNMIQVTAGNFTINDTSEGHDGSISTTSLTAINFGGDKLTINNGTVSAVTEDMFSGAMTICVSSGEVEINGGTVLGQSKSAYASARAIHVEQSDSDITVNGGTIEAKSAASYGYAYALEYSTKSTGTVSVTGGTINASSGRTPVIISNPGKKAEVAVSGGTFNAAIPVDQCAAGFIPKDNGDGTFSVKEGWKVTFDSDGGSAVKTQAVEKNAKASKPADPTKDHSIFNGWFAEGSSTAFDFETPITADIALKASWTETYVAQNGDNKYDTLAEAIEAAEAGDTVKLLKDIDLTSTQVIGKDVTIDLNGHDIAATGARAIWVKNGDVKITGEGTISANGDGLVESSSVIRVGDSAANTKPAKLTVGKDVTVSSGKCYGITVFGVNDSDNKLETSDIELVLNGKVAVTGTNPAVSGNGNSFNSATTVTIEADAEVTATQTYAIYHPDRGTLTVNGTVVGTGGIEIKSGKLVVGDGAKITATGTPTYPGVNNDGTSTSGYAVAAVSNSGYTEIPAVELNGGTLTGTVTSLPENGAEEYGAVTATSDSASVPEGYQWEQEGDHYVLKTPLDLAKEAALDALNSTDIDEYIESHQYRVHRLIEATKKSVGAATTIEEVDEIMASFREDLAKLTTLDAAKEIAKAELEAYKADVAFAEEAARDSIVTDGKSAIDAATTSEAVDDALANAKSRIDALPTKDANDKEIAKEALEATVADTEELTEADYTAESWAALQAAVAEAKEVLGDVEATKRQYNNAKAAVDAAVAALVTKADADAEAAAEALAEAKQTAIDKVNAVDKADYIETDRSKVEAAKAAALEAINAEDATEESIATALETFDAAIAACKTQAAADEEAAETLQILKDGSKDALYQYWNLDDYRDHEKIELMTIRSDAEKAIDACTTSAEVISAYADAAEKLGAVKTAAAYEREEAEAALEAAKQAARDRVNAVKKADYIESDQDDVEAAQQAALEAINAEDATAETIAAALETFDAAIAECKTQAAADAEAAQTLSEQKSLAKSILAAYKKDVVYRDAEKTAMRAIKADGRDAIDAAANAEDVTLALETALNEINALKTDADYAAEEAAAALAEAKQAALDKVNAVDKADFIEEDQSKVEAAKADALEAINAEDATAETIGAAIEAFDAAIAECKTQAETLAIVKAGLIDALNDYRKEVVYRDAEKTALRAIKADARDAIDAATSVEKAVTALLAAQLEIDDLKTAEDYEREEAEAALEAAKQAARDRVNAVNKADYIESDQDDVEAAQAAALEAINAEDATAETIGAALEAFDAAIAECKLQATADAEAAQTLAQQKALAKSILAGYRKDEVYRDAEKTAMRAIKADGREAIDAAANAEDLTAALEAALNEINALKTDADYAVEEAAAALAEAKQAALEKVNAVDKTDYIEADRSKVESAKAAALEAINAEDATTGSIAAALEAFDTAIAACKTQAAADAESAQALAEQKGALKEALNDYKKDEVYRAAERTALRAIKAEARDAIDTATTFEEAVAALIAASQEIDSLKTAADYERDEAEAAFEAAKQAARDKVNAVNKADYIESDQDDVEAAKASALEVIDAENVTAEEIADALDTFDAAIAECKLQAAADAEAAQTLAEQKALAKSILAGYQKDAVYRDAEKTAMRAIKADGREAIDAAANAEDVTIALQAALNEINALKTDADYAVEEAAAAEAALETAKADAKTALAGYRNAADYREEQQTALADAVATGNAAIEAAATPAEAEAALEAAKAQIDKIKTKSEMDIEDKISDLEDRIDDAQGDESDLQKQIDELKKQLHQSILDGIDVTVMAGASSYNSITVTWNTSKRKIDGVNATYNIYYRKAGDAEWQLLTAQQCDGSGKTMSFKLKNADTGSTYEFYGVASVKIGEEDEVTGSDSMIATAKPVLAKVSFTKLARGKKKLKVKFNKVTGATGYQIEYRMAGKKAQKINMKASNKKIVSRTIKKLTGKKRYYVRIRAYRTVNGKNVYGAWSVKRSVKIK